MNFKDFKGACDPLPKPGQKRFRVSVALFHSLDQEFETLKEAVAAIDPELNMLLKSPDMKSASIQIYIGDPEEELEMFLEDSNAELEAAGLSYAGFLVLNRAAVLGDNDDLPQSDEEWDRLTPEFKMTPAIQRLFDHLSKNYIPTGTYN